MGLNQTIFVHNTIRYALQQFIVWQVSEIFLEKSVKIFQCLFEEYFNFRLTYCKYFLTLLVSRSANAKWCISEILCLHLVKNWPVSFWLPRNICDQCHICHQISYTSTRVIVLLSLSSTLSPVELSYRSGDFLVITIFVSGLAASSNLNFYYIKIVLPRNQGPKTRTTNKVDTSESDACETTLTCSLHITGHYINGRKRDFGGDFVR